MSSYVLTAVAGYTQFARNDRYLLVPFESVVALEQSMHNKHAFAQIHPKVGWVDLLGLPILLLSTSRTVFIRQGFTRPNNRQTLQSTIQSIRKELSAWSVPFFTVDFDGRSGTVAICRLTFQRSAPGVLKRDHCDHCDHCERITDKRRPNSATPSVPWIGLVTTDVPQSSKINWIEASKRILSVPAVAVLLRVHLTKRLQYTVVARHRSLWKQDLLQRTDHARQSARP